MPKAGVGWKGGIRGFDMTPIAAMTKLVVLRALMPGAAW